MGRLYFLGRNEEKRAACRKKTVPVVSIRGCYGFYLAQSALFAADAGIEIPNDAYQFLGHCQLT